jgi:hypothetical protein
MLLTLWTSATAQAADSGPPPPSSYQQVMQAQYAAKAAPVPAPPEEAQRIYDAYLRSIGQPTKDSSLEPGSNAGMPSH